MQLIVESARDSSQRLAWRDGKDHTGTLHEVVRRYLSFRTLTNDSMKMAELNYQTTIKLVTMNELAHRSGVYCIVFQPKLELPARCKHWHTNSAHHVLKYLVFSRVTCLRESWIQIWTFKFINP